MPRTKLNLTRSEHIEHIARAAQLRAMGIDIEVSPPPSSASAADFELGDNFDYVCNLFSDIIIVIGARFTAQASGVLQADEVAVSLPGQGHIWDLMELPRGKEPLPGLALNRDEVLNDRLAAGVRLRRGEVLCGVLVLVGWDAHLPPECAHGTHLRIEIVLSDCSGAELKAKSTVYVNRRLEAKLRSVAHKKKMAEGFGLHAGKPALSIMEELARSSAEKPQPSMHRQDS